MSDGVPVPAVWPPDTTTSTNIYPVMPVDEGSYHLKENILNVDTEASQVYRVENLPDDSTAIDRAVVAAMLAYPAHPSAAFTGMLIESAGPLFGHTHLKGNSMVVERMMETDAGLSVKTVSSAGVVGVGETGTVGTVVLVKIIYGWPKTLPGF